MLPRSLDSYGGAFVDATAVENPENTLSAAYYVRLAEDVAQGSRTSQKAVVRFATSTSGSLPLAITPSAGRCHNGTGSAQLPTVSKTATGRYTVTYPEDWTDALDEEETVTFSFSSGRVSDLSTAGHVQTTVSGRVISVAVFDMAGAASDLGGSVVIEVDAR